MKIVIENKIPFIAGIFEPYAEVAYLSPDDITPDSVRDADALIVRTRTRCDESLLSGSACRIVATATIGTDHIDMAWCKANGIAVANAPGCNAPAVAQYVYASAASLLNGDIAGHTIGIVGVGHVGSIVAAWGEALGMRVLRCDPPRAERENAEEFLPLSIIAEESDIITLHTPLERNGAYPTWHIADRRFFNSLRKQPVFINAARGPVTDTEALIEAISGGKVSRTAIDCWEREPNIDTRLLAMADIATPHIAGYSREGKMRATQAAVRAVASVLGLPAAERAACAVTPATEITIEAVKASYRPMDDTIRLKANPDSFEALRNGYSLRAEVTP